ncbi:galectin 17 [Clinocottus analis]|uniref:galectin 17 n=1 Tax=Clinocottus analis TaxID=304258 RepID=UPI0035C0990D
MDTVSELIWVLLGLLASAESSSPPPRYLSVTCQVGGRAVLPCSWKRRPGEEAAARHVQWATPDDPVFELRGERRWTAESLRGRADVPRAELGGGDCSLVISDAQIGDSGRYLGFMLLDGRGAKTRLFLQRVRLSVLDHKSLQARGAGEDLELELYTRHSERLVFQDRNSSRWAELWAREDGDSERLVKHPLDERLTMKKLSSADEGTYKVLDEHGLAVSTVQLSVEGSSTALRAQQLLEERAPAGDGATSSCSPLLVFALLATSLQTTLVW